MMLPPYLEKGDKIAIVSTARKIKMEEMESCMEIIKSWGLLLVTGKTISLENYQFAGTDQERATDFQKMLDDDTIKAIWCARGGYGTVRMIDLLDFSKFITNPKWIIGYSDVTVLHSHIHNLGIATIHGPMPVDFFNATDEAYQSLEKAIFGQKQAFVTPSSKKNRKGNAQGVVVGGNLSILYSLCGSVSSINTDGKILCIEDLDEYLYHIDRMLQNLKRNDYFENLRGLIVGSMKNMHDNKIPFGKKVKGIILDIVKEYDFPVVFNFPMGHIQDNRTLLLGAEVMLKVTEDEVRLDYI